MNHPLFPAASPSALDWLERAFTVDGGTLAVLNRAGVDALRANGRAALLAALGIQAASPIRLLDAVPADTSTTAIGVLLQAPRPRQPDLLSDVVHADGSRTLHLRVPLDLEHFDGHFPTAPVLPGVLQVGWALELAAPRLHLLERCRAMEALKFQRLLRPGDRPELDLRLDADRGKLHFAYRLDGAHASSGRLLVERADG